MGQQDFKKPRASQRWKLFGLRFLAGMGIVAALYTLLWFSIRGYVELQIDTMKSVAALHGIVIEPIGNAITGFPFAYTLLFRGEFNTPSYSGKIPRGVLRFSLLPKSNLYFDAESVDVTALRLPRPLKIDHFSIIVDNLETFPWSLSLSDMKAWQKNGGTIKILDMNLIGENLIMKGQGELNLDENLQLGGQIDTTTSGLDLLMTKWAQEKILDSNRVLMAQSVLQFLAQNDPETQKQVLALPVRFQNLGVFLGPMRVGTLSPLAWIPDEPLPQTLNQQQESQTLLRQEEATQPAPHQ